MEVRYSTHVQFKLKVRNIAPEVPRRIYFESNQRYKNHHTVRFVAIMTVYYHRRHTVMMIAYDQHPEYAEIITIHPITKDQIKDRLASGRWTYEE